jgi:hypothetical protein
MKRRGNVVVASLSETSERKNGLWGSVEIARRSSYPARGTGLTRGPATRPPNVFIMIKFAQRTASCSQLNSAGGPLQKDPEESLW